MAVVATRGIRLHLPRAPGVAEMAFSQHTGIAPKPPSVRDAYAVTSASIKCGKHHDRRKRYSKGLRARFSSRFERAPRFF